MVLGKDISECDVNLKESERRGGFNLFEKVCKRVCQMTKSE